MVFGESSSLPQAPVNTCEFVVGHLLEIRVAAGYRSVEDVDDMIAKMMAAAATLPSEVKFVIVADWRSVTVMAPDTAARVKQMLERSNPRVVRSSILIQPTHATTGLQALRLVKEAANANRRHFTSAREQIAWLGEVLTPAETQRLRGFLGEDG